MRGGRSGPLIVKECRALVPIWIASAIAIAAAALSGIRNHELGLVAYGFGSAALGAQSIGHEYTSRTLTLLLSQPRGRRQLLLAKFAVLIAMLVALTAFARLTLLTPNDNAWVALTVLNALFVAPLLTMACRTPVAGVVFTGAAPFWILAIGGYVSGRVLWGSALTLFAAAAIAGWRLFMRLEAIDGLGAHVRLPDVFQRHFGSSGTLAGSVRRQHPVWLLVKKELHLQQLTFAATIACTVIWLGIGAATWIIPGFDGFPVSAVGILYGGLMALLIGSLASAEERHLGTLEWQLLVPVAAWQQWSVKVMTAVGLAGVLSFALPIALARGEIGVNAWHAGSILTMTIGSLYVSSLCRSSIRAVATAGPVMLTLTLVFGYAAGIYQIGFQGKHLEALTGWPLAIVIPLLLWFAFENHRSAGQSAGRVSAQLAWIAGSAALAFAVVTAVV